MAAPASSETKPLVATAVDESTEAALPSATAPSAALVGGSPTTNVNVNVNVTGGGRPRTLAPPALSSSPVPHRLFAPATQSSVCRRAQAPCISSRRPAAAASSGARVWRCAATKAARATCAAPAASAAGSLYAAGPRRWYPRLCPRLQSSGWSDDAGVPHRVRGARCTNNVPTVLVT
eukprot:COSAG02_NODE_12440_length_1544_cov_1.796540_1_plen_177_part_00